MRHDKPTNQLAWSAAPRPPMRGRYFIRHPLANLAFRLLDEGLAALRSGQRPNNGGPIRRLLLTNGAHLGDVVLSTAAIEAIHARFPDAEIGMIVGSWSLPVVANHPLLKWIHVVDHWKIDRSAAPRWKKFLLYRRSRAKALAEIDAIGYDAAVDLYFYFPNSIALLWQARIPRRIGFTSGGFGPLLTDPVDFVHGRGSILLYYSELLRRLPGAPSGEGAPIQTSLTSSREDLPPVLQSLPAYLVLHPGSGSTLKEWGVPAWRELAQALSDEGWTLVFTGHGQREHENVKSIMVGLSQAIDLCGALSWPSFLAVVAFTRLLIGVDSVAAHVAGATRTPSVTIGNGMNDQALWRPAGGRAQVLTHLMACAPCYRSEGCATMDCVRGVSVKAMLSAVQLALTDCAANPQVTVGPVDAAYQQDACR